MYCPKCHKTYSATRTIINLQNLPVDEEFDPYFCPVCGWCRVENEEPVIEVKEMNIYDKVHRYINCIVEVLENSVTGQTSVGWYRTDETREIFDWEPEE